MEQLTQVNQGCLHKMEYFDALTAAQDVVLKEAVKLHSMFSSHSVEDFYEAIMQQLRIKGLKKRLTTGMLTSARSYGPSMIISAASDSKHKTASQFAKELRATWNGLSLEDVTNVPSRGILQTQPNGA
ncbi:hypothetical protein CONPUDRAFT_148389 [Coniophora puteana RWD-64-598 SS2]|uniref:Uncharacterized protein n=1 Tax=Coniophora puteana (strain RWD-64-598) TaxID=741705 RepID=A0A5M3N4H0_CONPW|nr:uncharacterized protein CONPUDRAFT_148389 [Coniophora puteana RWD-64-598 SS2]EIW86293.1 hypothetical protein CONPUDRAFT_148389 [Coniophora puteana RWD-64-598 SS2]